MKESNANRKRAASYEKIFDDVLKTFQQKMPKFIIPLINEAHKTQYPFDVTFDEPRNEYVTDKGKRTADSVIRLDGRIYHAEIQANPDSRMNKRMVEYDFAIALNFAENAEAKADVENELMVELPESLVFYLRHNRNTPDMLVTKIRSGISEITRTVPIIKLKNYTLDEIAEKNLLIFLPYYILNYEAQLKTEYKKTNDIAENTLDRLKGDYNKIGKIISDKLSSTDEVAKGRIHNLIDRVAEHVMEQIGFDDKTKKEVRTAMGGGQVLELEVDIAEARGITIGKCNNAERVFINMIERGYDVAEAVAISEISEARAKQLLKDKIAYRS